MFNIKLCGVDGSILYRGNIQGLAKALEPSVLSETILIAFEYDNDVDEEPIEVKRFAQWGY